MAGMRAQAHISADPRIALSVRRLTRSFGGLKAVSEVSFDVASGRVTAMIGPNGAGKTTVFNLITNILASDAGQVVFLGRDLARLSPVKIASLGLIRTFQSARVFAGVGVGRGVDAA